jgi:hypothetical protein
MLSLAQMYEGRARGSYSISCRCPGYNRARMGRVHTSLAAFLLELRCKGKVRYMHT